MRTLGHSYGYWVPREVKRWMQGCPCSDLCLVSATQREGFQPVDLEIHSGLVKEFRRLPAPQLVDVSGDSFAKVFAGLLFPIYRTVCLFEPVNVHY